MAPLLPWPVEALSAVPVRGNVPTRLTKLIAGSAPALLVAKAALDRLLDPRQPFDDSRRAVRAALDECRWMVLPISECPTAPAQGALAIDHAQDGALGTFVLFLLWSYVNAWVLLFCGQLPGVLLRPGSSRSEAQ